MRQPNLPSCFIAFAIIWSTWSTWNTIEPFMSSEQLSAAFLFLPISALLIGFSLIDRDEDDDDFGGGLMQPVLNETSN